MNSSHNSDILACRAANLKNFNERGKLHRNRRRGGEEKRAANARLERRGALLHNDTSIPHHRQRSLPAARLRNPGRRRQSDRLPQRSQRQRLPDSDVRAVGRGHRLRDRHQRLDLRGFTDLDIRPPRPAFGLAANIERPAIIRRRRRRVGSDHHRRVCHGRLVRQRECDDHGERRRNEAAVVAGAPTLRLSNGATVAFDANLSNSARSREIRRALTARHAHCRRQACSV